MKDSHYTQGIRPPLFKDFRCHKYFTSDVRWRLLYVWGKWVFYITSWKLFSLHLQIKWSLQRTFIPIWSILRYEKNVCVYIMVVMAVFPPDVPKPFSKLMSYLYCAFSSLGAPSFHWALQKTIKKTPGSKTLRTTTFKMIPCSHKCVVSFLKPYILSSFFL